MAICFGLEDINRPHDTTTTGPRPCAGDQECADAATVECEVGVCGDDGMCTTAPAPADTPCGDATSLECSAPDTCDGWLITGSRHGAYEEHDWIPPLEAFIRDCFAARVPMIGVCFGHQIIAQAMGGKVVKFGGGWAVVPVLNLVMAVPLKVAAASSGVLLAMGNAAAIWPYITGGALIAVLAAPWMLGQVIGGILGAHILAKIKAGIVRQILIVLLVLTSLKLIAKGIEGLTGIDIPIL